MAGRTLKLSANLSFLFAEFPFAERFARAARAGFRGVEFMFPFDREVGELRRLLHEYRLTQVLYNLPAGDWAAGERGIACIPGREREFREGVDLAIDYARALGCSRLNCLAGLTPIGVADDEIRATFAANLRDAARRLSAHGIQLLVEPINSRVDMPGFWLDTTAKALATIAAIDDAKLYLQYDLYHAQIMHDDLARTIEANIGRIAHFQIADHPGRHEPGTGEIGYPFLLRLIETLGYQGWIGCEYRPLTGDSAVSLGWARDWLSADG